MKKLNLALLSLLLIGCATVYFPPKDYVLPGNHQIEMNNLWVDLRKQIDLKYEYKIKVIDGDVSDELKGVPSISNRVIYLPKDFIKYVYLNHYNDRYFIFGSVIIHEMMHSEVGLPSKPPQEHVKTDVAAIKVMGEDEETIRNYCRALYVMQKYWLARQGAAKHALNIGWNIVNAASLYYAGTGYFRDWFATDLKIRIKMIKNHYGVKVYTPFDRSSFKNPGGES